MIDIQENEGIIQNYWITPRHSYTCVGWLPECRSSTIQQWVQGGSGGSLINLLHPAVDEMLSILDGDPILAEFFVK